MAFGFGPLPAGSGSPSGITMEDLARLFGQAPMGAGQGFSGSATGPVPDAATLEPPAGPQPVNVPLPPQRPLSFGPMPKPPATSQADMPAPDVQPIIGQAPISIAPPAQPQAAAPPAPEGPSFLERLGSGLSRNSDALIGFGTGLMSTPGFGAGAAAGFQNAQKATALASASDLARAELGLKQSKLAREQRGENATAAFLKAKGFDDALATAAMSNPTVLSSVLSQMNRDPSIVEIGGNKYSLKPGEKPTEANLLGPSGAEKDKATLVDVTQPDGSIVKTWLKPGETAGAPVGAPVRTSVQLLDTPEKRAAAGIQPTDTRTARMDREGKVHYDPAPPAPTVHVLEDENGIKHIRQYDPQTQRWVDPAQPPGAPPAPTNPLALKGKTTNEQSKAAGFSDRMLGSESILAAKENEGTNFWERTKDGIPVVGNYFTSDGYQSYNQAKRDFINAQLRRESGAAIGKDEFASAEKQYFPQPGDGEATIRQKAANRRTSIEAMIREGGTTYLPTKVFNEKGALVPYGPGQRPGSAQPSAPTALPPSPNGAPPPIATKEDYDRLPSGTPYMAPDGSLRTKP